MLSAVNSSSSFSAGRGAALACFLEATAPKPGNVHRGADFDDLSYSDLVIAGIAIAPAMDAAAVGKRVGEAVLSAVEATRYVVATNANLGIILLLGPLAAVPRDRPLASGVQHVLDGLDAEDARLVYEAIRLARPGGLGHTAAADVLGDSPASLVEAMRLAAERDLVARQYANGFQEVLTCVMPAILTGLDSGWPLDVAIVDAHLQTMSKFPDSLIARKCGAAAAQESAARAAEVLKAGRPGEPAYQCAADDLDRWLRADGHRRNPGTTADVITAALFAALRDGLIKMPL